MLSEDLMNLAAALSEAARANRVSADLVIGAVLQLTGMTAQAAALEAARPPVAEEPCDGPELEEVVTALRRRARPVLVERQKPSTVDLALQVLRNAVAAEVRRELRGAS